MEFQESLVRLTMKEPSEKQLQRRRSQKASKNSPDSETGVSRSRRSWKIFHRSSSSISSHSTASTTATTAAKSPVSPPREFLCPISGALMAEPVIVSSGHTFERACAEACKALSFSPIMSDSSAADFSSVIPNLALKSAISAWIGTSSTGTPVPPDSVTAENLVRFFMASRDPPPPKITKNKNHRPKAVSVDSISTENLVGEEKNKQPVSVDPMATELARRRRSSGYHSNYSTSSSSSSLSSASSEVEIGNPKLLFEEEEIVAKLKSPRVSEAEEAAAALRRITRTREDSRAHLCTYRLLSVLKTLIAAPSKLQNDALASTVNLSLDPANKGKIVRAGLVPHLVNVLRSGSREAQDHAVAAFFSLALDPDSRAAVGVLGALGPLLHTLRGAGGASSEQTRRDAALALFHLSLVRTNRTKLVKAGAVPVLLGMVKARDMAPQIFPVMGNLGMSEEGRAAMMDSGAVEEMVKAAAEGKGMREGAVGVLFALSGGGHHRFKALAKEARVGEALGAPEMGGESETTRMRATAVLEVVNRRRGDDVDGDEVNWEELLDSGFDTDT